MRLTANDAVVSAVAAGAGVALVALVWAWLVRRSTGRRLAALAARLDDTGGGLVEGGKVDRNLSRLERVTEAAVTTLGEARLARDRLSRVLSGLGEGVVILDEGSEVVFQNDQAAALLQEGGDAAVQRSVADLIRAAADGAAQRQTVEIYGPPRRTLAISALPLDDGWRPIGIAAVIEDLSERRRLEATRRDFVANVTHELKTPVGTVAALADALAEGDDVKAAVSIAARLSDEARQLARVFDDLLDLSRVEAEEAPAREPVPVHLLVADAIEQVRSVAERRSVVITADDGPRDLVVLGDRRQLVSALFNLLENAVKCSEPGAAVDLRVRMKGDSLELEVRDEGMGIPARDVERIFERFYRIERARAAGPGGSGVGLAIVRHVAARHGGEVEVESHEGTGSTFRLRLPVAPPRLPITRATQVIQGTDADAATEGTDAARAAGAAQVSAG
jgi:two-component system sensor histidine kinase SenX3